MPRFTADHWPHNRALIERFEALALSAGGHGGATGADVGDGAG
ncbi:hypothetical protein ACFSTD_04680 [Novosphingobium colocasiae]